MAWILILIGLVIAISHISLVDPGGCLLRNGALGVLPGFLGCSVSRNPGIAVNFKQSDRAISWISVTAQISHTARPWSIGAIYWAASLGEAF